MTETLPFTSRDYEGAELGLFADAANWKGYVRSLVRPYLGREVLEVGAGIGGTTRHLCDGSTREWVCLEPDEGMAAHLDALLGRGELPACCTVRRGVVADLPAEPLADTILYMDVLEHIEHDAEEVAAAGARLRPGGRVVVLSPAHNWLYTPFDRAIGHYRRYRARDARRLTPPGLRLVRNSYLDATGLLASLANRLVLRSAMPTRGQVQTWDRGMVPVSRVLDPLLGFRLGKSILMVWEKPAA